MGNLLGAVQIFRDISREKENDQMKSDVLSLVSHQLKTPIGQLNAYLDNMLSGVVGEFTSAQKEYLANMHQVINRLTKMTNNILNASRIERGVIQYNIQPVALKPILNQIYEDNIKAAAAKGTNLEYQNQTDLTVAADEIKLTEVISDVVDNAVKFTDKGGVQISVRSEDKMAVIEIKDTGPGMNQAMLAKLFARDKGIEQAETSKAGSRLGMYIAKIFMEKQRGDIKATSTEGVGSTFLIYIPLAN